MRPGVAAGVIADRLGSGRLLAIDRSATAIDRATRRNQRPIEAGRVEFRRAALVELAALNGPFAGPGSLPASDVTGMR